MADRNEDVLGVYASTSDGEKVTMVIVNKDVVPVNLAISNIPAGSYFLRHFGGDAGVAKWQVGPSSCSSLFPLADSLRSLVDYDRDRCE